MSSGGSRLSFVSKILTSDHLHLHELEIQLEGIFVIVLRLTFRPRSIPGEKIMEMPSFLGSPENFSTK